MLRRAALVLSSILVLAFVAWQVHQREQAHRVGRTIYLPLSLGAGLREDGGVQLDWQLSRVLRSSIERDPQRREGELLVLVDDRGIGSVLRFVREDEELDRRSWRLRYHLSEGGIVLGSTAFHLPEGGRQAFASVAFGELIITPDGDAILVALCGRALERIPFPEGLE